MTNTTRTDERILSDLSAITPAPLLDYARTVPTGHLLDMLDLLDGKPSPERYSRDVVASIGAVDCVLSERIEEISKDAAWELLYWVAYYDGTTPRASTLYRAVLRLPVDGFDLEAARAEREAQRVVSLAATNAKRAASGMAPEQLTPCVPFAWYAGPALIEA